MYEDFLSVLHKLELIGYLDFFIMSIMRDNNFGGKRDDGSKSVHI